MLLISKIVHFQRNNWLENSKYFSALLHNSQPFWGVRKNDCPESFINYQENTCDRIFYHQSNKYRSNHQRSSVRKGVVRNFAKRLIQNYNLEKITKLQEERLWWSTFLIKLQICSIPLLELDYTIFDFW